MTLKKPVKKIMTVESSTRASNCMCKYACTCQAVDYTRERNESYRSNYSNASLTGGPSWS